MKGAWVADQRRTEKAVSEGQNPFSLQKGLRIERRHLVPAHKQKQITGATQAFTKEL